MSQARRPSNQNRPGVSRPGSTGLRFGMFAICVSRDPDAGLNSGKAKPLYDLLVSFADVSSRDTEKGYPYRETLASCLDCSKQTVDRAADYLAREIGLVTVHRRKVEGKPDENDANLYEIHDAWLIHGVTPPAGTPPQLVARYGHTIPGLNVEAWVSEHAASFDLHAWRAAYGEKLRAQEAKREEQRRKERARRKKPKKGGGVMGDATPEGAEERGGSVMGDATGGVMDDVSGGVMDDALSKAGGPEPSSTNDEAPSGRSPGERRRPSTGSSERASGSGCAASGKDSPSPSSSNADRASTSKSRVRLTAEQRQARNEILSLLPPDLRQALGEVIPKNVCQSLLKALAVGMPRERTPQQLVTYRLLPRWQRYWSPKFYAGELAPEANGKKRPPFGPLLEMIKDTAECQNLACEDRHDFVLDDNCRNCAMRKVDQAADRERERRGAEEDAERQARRGEAHAAAGEAAPASADATSASATPVPVQRNSMVLHTPPVRRECAEDSCALTLPEGWDDELCKKCRTRADRAARIFRQQAAATRYEAPEDALASAGPAPF